MAAHLSLSVAILLIITISSGPHLLECTNITVVNRCSETVWPGITPSENISSSTDSPLKPGQSTVFSAPSGWHGSIWGRTGCSFDTAGNGTCQTGSCGTSLNCTGPSPQPATIAEFTIGDTDYYDVSLVGGFNLPMIVSPLHGKGNCSTAGCDADLRDNCPSELAVTSDGKTVACRNACDVFNTDEYCCRGMFGNPSACQATNYSTTFKKVCPAAYSYAYDDRTSIVTCSSVSDYAVTFCATRNQTQCTYHDQQLACNTSGLPKSKNALPQIGWILIYMFWLVIS